MTKRLFTKPASCFFLSFFFLLATGCSAEQPPDYENSPLVVEEISFQNGDVGLAGSIIYSEAAKDVGGRPGVIFVPGSGDGPRYFLQTVAEWYAKQGFVALIYDKRGSGQSGGNWITSSLEDLADDAVAGLGILAENPLVNSDKIGVWGISQGGWVIPVLSQKTDIPAWGIVVTGGGATPRATEAFAYEQTLDFHGASQDGKEKALALVDRYLEYLATGQDRDDLVIAIEAAKTEPWYPSLNLDQILVSDQNQPNWQWVAQYDPLPDASRLQFPLLVMLGSADFSTPVQASSAGWKQAFLNSGSETSKVVIFEGVGHGLVAGNHEEAMHGPPTYVEGYFATQKDWLKEIGVID